MRTSGEILLLGSSLIFSSLSSLTNFQYSDGSFLERLSSFSILFLLIARFFFLHAWLYNLQNLLKESHITGSSGYLE